MKKATWKLLQLRNLEEKILIKRKLKGKIACCRVQASVEHVTIHRRDEPISGHNGMAPELLVGPKHVKKNHKNTILTNNSLNHINYRPVIIQMSESICNDLQTLSNHLIRVFDDVKMRWTHCALIRRLRYQIEFSVVKF